MFEFIKAFYYLTKPMGAYEHVEFVFILPVAMVYFTYLQVTR